MIPSYGLVTLYRVSGGPICSVYATERGHLGGGIIIGARACEVSVCGMGGRGMWSGNEKGEIHFEIRFSGEDALI